MYISCDTTYRVPECKCSLQVALEVSGMREPFVSSLCLDSLARGLCSGFALCRQFVQVRLDRNAESAVYIAQERQTADIISTYVKTAINITYLKLI
jgi:hypothetical protein